MKYALTYLTSIFGLFATFLSIGVLARIFSYEDFLNFMLINRYFGFLLIVVLFGSNISLPILCSRYKSASKANLIYSIFSTVCIYIILTFFFVFFETSLPFKISFLSTIWLLGLGMLTSIVFFYRGINKNNISNIILIFFKYLPVMILPLIMKFNTSISSIDSYFSLLGIIFLVLAFLLIILIFASRDISDLNKSDLFKYFNFSFWKTTDEIVRFGSYIFIIIFINSKFGNEAAGIVSIYLVFIKTSESILQSLISVFSSDIASGRILITKIPPYYFFLIGLAINFIAFFIFNSFGVKILTLWLGLDYVDLFEDILVIISIIGFIFMSSMLRAPLDNRFIISPNLIANIFMLVSFISLSNSGISEAVSLCASSTLRFIILISIYKFCRYKVIT
jgi:O-antigen/teichoic acid export membrane protein